MSDVQFDLLIGVLSLLALISLVTLVAFLIEASKLTQLFTEVEKFKVSNNAELNSMVWHEKKLEGEVSEIILELRRTNKLLYEMRGAGVTDFIQEYHDSDTFRRERTSKFKTNLNLKSENNEAKPAVTTNGKQKSHSINALTKTPVITHTKTSAPAKIDAAIQTPVVSRKDKVARRAEFMKKISQTGGSNENLVQKMLSGN